MVKDRNHFVKERMVKLIYCMVVVEHIDLIFQIHLLGGGEGV